MIAASILHAVVFLLIVSGLEYPGRKRVIAPLPVVRSNDLRGARRTGK